MRLKYIYKIVNTKNNKIYIGQTYNFKDRVNAHKRDLRKNKHINMDLQSDCTLYSINSFSFEIIEVVNEDVAKQREDYWINFYGGVDSDITYNRYSNVTQCRKSRNLHKYIASKTHYISSDGKLRISKANKGKIISNEQKAKISENAKNNPHYGMKNKKHSEYSKKLMSEKKRGKYLGSANPNYKYTPEFIEELRESYKLYYNYNKLSTIYNINRRTIASLVKFGHT